MMKESNNFSAMQQKRKRHQMPMNYKEMKDNVHIPSKATLRSKLSTISKHKINNQTPISTDCTNRWVLKLK